MEAEKMTELTGDSNYADKQQVMVARLEEQFGERGNIKVNPLTVTFWVRKDNLEFGDETALGEMAEGVPGMTEMSVSENDYIATYRWVKEGMEA